MGRILTSGFQPAALHIIMNLQSQETARNTLYNAIHEPLTLSLIPQDQHRLDYGDTVLPVHECVIRPIMRAAIQAWVYRGTVEPHERESGAGWVEPLDLSSFPILIPDRGKFRFDLSRECVTGYERLWNATWHCRGSIVVVLPADFDFSAIFQYGRDLGYDVNYNATPNMGHSPAAVKKCRMEMAQGHIAVIFSASNGVEWMDIYMPDRKPEPA